MYKPFILILISITCSIFIANGQDENTIITKPQNPLNFYLLDMELGLAHNVINSITQDELGYIWIGTNEGMSRYNGSKFQNFKQNLDNPESSLANNFVQQIKAIGNNKLMMATDGGLITYDILKEKFDVLQQKDGLISNSISAFQHTPEGKLILGGYRYGVQVINKNGKIEHTIIHNPNSQSGLSSNQISSVALQGDSIAWIGTYDQGLNKLNLINKANQRVNLSILGKKVSQINSLYSDIDGNIWIGTNEGLRVITVKGDTLALKAGKNQNSGLSDTDVLCFEEDGDGNIWIGTRNGGLNILEKSHFLQSKHLNLVWHLPKSDGSSVYNRTVSAIKKDEDGNMWLGTSTGLNFVNPKGEAITLIQKNPMADHSISHERIGSIATSMFSNRIWIGTDGGGLDKYNPEDRSISNFRSHQANSNSLTSDYIIALKEDSKERLWIGTYQGGLNKLDVKTGKIKRYLQGHVRDGADVRVIAEDVLSNIWVGTNQGGLYKYDEINDTFEYIRELGKLDIRGIAFDEKGNLWLATFGSGIIRYDPNSGSSKSFLTKELAAINVYFGIAILPNQDVLIGSRYGGLIRLDPKNETYKAFTEADGLSNNTIVSMQIDDQGVVWLGTNNGISYYHPTSNQIGHLNAFDNIQKSEFNIGAVALSRDGNLIFGGNKGVNIIHPQKITQKLNQRLIIENLKLFNDKIYAGDVFLDSAISYKQKLQFNYLQTLISIDFSLLKFPFAQQVNYAYKLENYHDHWIQVQGNGSANLSNIPPGNYTLRVKARIGNEQEVERKILLTITPPFWKTPPAYFLYFVLILIVIILSLRYYNDRLKLKNSLELERQQRILEHDVNEERIRFFTSFSHELKTPLTLILAPIEDLIGQIKSKSQLSKLSIVQKNAAYLHQLIGNLLEFRKAETGLSQLNVGEYNLSMYLEQWVQNYKPLAKKQHIELSCVLSERNMMVKFDFEKLQIIFNNLVSNALKYAQKDDKVLISLSSDQEYFRLSVADSGPGIALEERKRIFEWFYQTGNKHKKSGTGIGLALVKSLTELHHGTVEVDSEPKKGTIFTISIPKTLEISNTDYLPINQTNMDFDHMTEMLLIEDQPYQEVLVNADEERPIVLLIDDNIDILSYLDSLLKKHYDLIHAQNGEEGVEKALKYVPDLIISDIMMPLKDGLDLCIYLKQNDITSHIPIILLSAKGNIESMQTGYKEGADDYITKPFNSMLLQTRVQNLIENRKKLRKHFAAQEQAVDTSPLDAKDHDLLHVEKKFLHKLDQIILEQIGKEETQVDNIVAEMGMSRTSLFRKIKAITGYNINAYIRMIKVKRAAQLISEHKIPVSQAAYEAGFNDIKYFRKVFKEHFGELPSSYKS
ncbi:two-component regulator propeller domain-containing protein [Belliella kenyensis]|uniref:histidine kinase n=1 Tax=Belliella kenyensis TaxID=1472724 RepID=A0ABV8EF19_9BACT|nr:two-component regulator propeller domain-containing protein [Belliella kenyensis]MCH7401869.1 ATP-binding protein [Belliella kenyensis]MDN3604369.1 two-component regulator propeller domain-containing protein [Belliella kenyensis]